MTWKFVQPTARNAINYHVTCLFAGEWRLKFLLSPLLIRKGIVFTSWSFALAISAIILLKIKSTSLSLKGYYIHVLLSQLAVRSHMTA